MSVYLRDGSQGRISGTDLLTHPSNMSVYLRDGSPHTSLRAATLRQKLHIKLSASPSHSIFTPGQPVPALTLERQAPGRVATGVPSLKSLVGLSRKNPRCASGNLIPDLPLWRRTRPPRRFAPRDRTAHQTIPSADITRCTHHDIRPSSLRTSRDAHIMTSDHPLCGHHGMHTS